MLEHSCPCDVDPTKHLCYQPVVDCTYFSVLGSFNNWNIIKFNNKTASSEYFDAVHKILLDGMGDNKASQV